MDEEEFEQEFTKGKKVKRRGGEESSEESDDEDVQRRSPAKKKGRKRKSNKKSKRTISDSQEDSDADTKSGPLPNRLQEEATRLHEDYLAKLESLAAEYKVDIRRVKRYLALDVTVHRKPNRYNVFLHARSVDDPPKDDGKKPSFSSIGYKLTIFRGQK